MFPGDRVASISNHFRDGTRCLRRNQSLRHEQLVRRETGKE